jgi:SNF2 family DNA or RNA helicase
MPLSGPFLIACPASVMSSWADELQRWAPALRVVHYKGNAQERERVHSTQVRQEVCH